MSSDNPTQKIWNSHYTKSKARLLYPDENLVRILSKLNLPDNKKSKALDLGCGSGRHSILLHSHGWDTIAVDYSSESIAILKEIAPELLSFTIDIPPYPFENGEFQVIVSWGVLHYNDDSTIQVMLDEVLRILEPGGYFVGTVRAHSDTLLKPDMNQKMNLQDLKGGFVQLMDETKLRKILKNFQDIKIGYMERSLLGDLNTKIAHYFFSARKSR